MLKKSDRSSLNSEKELPASNRIALKEPPLNTVLTPLILALAHLMRSNERPTLKKQLSKNKSHGESALVDIVPLDEAEIVDKIVE